MSLEDALRSLSDAHGPRALIAAFSRVQGEVRQRRRGLKQHWGVLAQTYMQAMQIWDAQKADGVPIGERLRGLERTLRSAWPQTREWKYLCEQCRDYGLVYSQCAGDRACGRQKAHLAHDYGRPCLCANGARYRDKPRPTAQDFREAGMTKVGKR